MSQALQNSLGRISRNRIINPDSAIDQRNNGAVLNLNTGTANYAADRSQISVSVSGKLSSQQHSVVLGASQPTNTSQKILVTSQYTPAVGEVFYRRQMLEGLRMRDLLWGSSFARPMIYTVCGSWPVAGVYSVSFRNDPVNRSYVSTFTVNQANVLETHSVVIPGDITGTWATNNTGHTTIDLSLGVSSTHTTSLLNQWQAGNFLKAAGSIDLVSQVNGSAMYIAWEQYERDMRTDFEVVPYEEQLRQCQRYYYQVAQTNPYEVAAIGQNLNTTQIYASHRIPVTMRATPNAGLAGSNFVSYELLGGGNLTDLGLSAATRDSIEMVATSVNTLVVGGFTRLMGHSAITNPWKLTASAEL